MLAAEGYTNAEIASRMFISERTAKAHLSSAANKLDMGRVQMARLVEPGRSAGAAVSRPVVEPYQS